jgi:hypothetical protein
MKKISSRDAQAIAAKVGAGEAFTTYGALSGYPVSGSVYTGIMPTSEIITFRERQQAGKITYVIQSYATPIAWLDIDHGWCFTTTRYSVTTSKHLGTARYATSIAVKVAA